MANRYVVSAETLQEIADLPTPDLSSLQNKVAALINDSERDSKHVKKYLVAYKI